MIHNSKFIDEMKQRLETQKENLIKELSGFANVSENDHGGWKSKFEVVGSSDEDSAQETETYERLRSLESALENNLSDVELALKRIGESTYGVCRHCNEGIDQARLEVRPESSSCIPCKKKLKGES